MNKNRRILLSLSLGLIKSNILKLRRRLKGSNIFVNDIKFLKNQYNIENVYSPPGWMISV